MEIEHEGVTHSVSVVKIGELHWRAKIFTARCWWAGEGRHATEAEAVLRLKLADPERGREAEVSAMRVRDLELALMGAAQAAEAAEQAARAAAEAALEADEAWSAAEAIYQEALEAHKAMMEASDGD
jgi:hypothetical protein